METISDIINKLEDYAKCGLAHNMKDRTQAKVWANRLRVECGIIDASEQSVQADSEGCSECESYSGGYNYIYCPWCGRKLRTA